MADLDPGSLAVPWDEDVRPDEEEEPPSLATPPPAHMKHALQSKDNDGGVEKKSDLVEPVKPTAVSEEPSVEPVTIAPTLAVVDAKVEENGGAPPSPLNDKENETNPASVGEVAVVSPLEEVQIPDSSPLEMEPMENIQTEPAAEKDNETTKAVASVGAVGAAAGVSALLNADGAPEDEMEDIVADISATIPEDELLDIAAKAETAAEEAVPENVKEEGDAKDKDNADTNEEAVPVDVVEEVEANDAAEEAVSVDAKEVVEPNDKDITDPAEEAVSVDDAKEEVEVEDEENADAAEEAVPVDVKEDVEDVPVSAKEAPEHSLVESAEVNKEDDDNIAECAPFEAAGVKEEDNAESPEPPSADSVEVKEDDGEISEMVPVESVDTEKEGDIETSRETLLDDSVEAKDEEKETSNKAVLAGLAAAGVAGGVAVAATLPSEVEENKERTVHLVDNAVESASAIEEVAVERAEPVPIKPTEVKGDDDADTLDLLVTPPEVNDQDDADTLDLLAAAADAKADDDADTLEEIMAESTEVEEHEKDDDFDQVRAASTEDQKEQDGKTDEVMDESTEVDDEEENSNNKILMTGLAAAGVAGIAAAATLPSGDDEKTERTVGLVVDTVPDFGPSGRDEETIVSISSPLYEPPLDDDPSLCSEKDMAMEQASNGRHPVPAINPTIIPAKEKSLDRGESYSFNEDGSIVSKEPKRDAVSEDPEYFGGMSNPEKIVAEISSSRQLPDGGADKELAVDKTEDNEAPWYCTKRFKLIAAGLILLAIIIGVAVPLASKDGSKDGSKDDSTDDSGGIELPTRSEQALGVVLGISDESALKDESSPQFSAYEWIVNEDTLSPLSNPPTEEEQAAFLQRYSLAVFYYSTQGGDWTSNTGWLDGMQDECGEPSWAHLSCKNGVVVTIDTGLSNNMTGAVPSEMNALSELRELFLFSNELTRISDTFAPPSLVHLDLGANSIAGTIPESIYQLSNLETLYIDKNEFSGTVSKSISGMTKLQEISLLVNNFNGTLTNELRPLVSLRVLALDRTFIEGKIFTIIDTLKNLEFLSLRDSLITGIISPDIQKYSSLQTLDLGRLGLAGTIPTEMGNVASLTNLLIDRSGLTGTIPTELGKLQNLKRLFIHVNELEGPVPEELCELPNLSEVRHDCKNECSCCDSNECVA